MEKEYKINVYEFMGTSTPSGRTSEDGSPAGDTLRAEIEKHWDTHEKIVISFDGVAKMTRPFLDEAFARLLEKFPLGDFNNKVFFPDASDIIVKDLNQALKLRLKIIQSQMAREDD